MATVLLMASLAPAPHGTSASCVRCPACLHYRGCATLVRKVHADCKSSRGILCERSVYKCADLGLFFTHPTVPTHLVAQLYANSAVHTATSTLKRLPRVLAQRHYIHEHLPLLPEQAVVVEVGCSTGWLLRAFDGPRRTLICFEPDASTAALANTSLTRGTQSSHVHVLPETFTIEALDAVLGAGAQIDLFLSSHVLEHLPDLCSFLSALHAKMAPGGAVFTELPNDTQERILHSPHDSQFHLSMTSPGGWLRLMENIGFVLGDLRTVRDFQTVGLNGLWSRSLLYKKNPADPSVVHGLQQNLSATRLAALAAPHADLCRHHADSLGLSVSDCIDGGFAGQVTAKPSFKGAGTQHVHRRVAHRSFSISSFAARLAAAETQHEPFEHLILNDILPADCLSQVVENYPTDVTIDERCVSRIWCPAGNRSNIMSGRALANGWPWPTWKEQRSTDRWRFWKSFYEVVNSTDVKQAWMALFSRSFKLRFGAAGLPRAEDLEFGLDFLQDTGAFELPPHTDVCSKLLSAILYLPFDDLAPEDHGTAIYVATQDAPLAAASCGETRKRWAGYLEVKRAPYRRNTLFAFAPCRSSWHGVPKSLVPRRSIFMWLRFVDPARRNGLSGPCTG